MADHRRRIERVVAHVRANLGGDLSLDALAEVAAMSRFHWHRVWRAATGETAAETVRRERLNRAAVLVGTTDMDLAEVARRCGLRDAPALGRAFRAAFGLTPRAARTRRLVPPALAAPNPGGGLIMPAVTIRADEEAELAALPHRGAYTAIGRTFGEVGPRLAAAGIRPAGPAYALYYDMPGVTPDRDLRAHAGLAVAPGTRLPPGFDRLRVPSGRVAVLLHEGPYDAIPGAWDAIYRWLGASEETEADAPPYERYLNGPGDVPPERLLTEICVPLKG